MNTPDYAQARTNMVDCQIHTNGVIDPAILRAFQTLPRELFVPENLKSVAYKDEDIVMPNGRILLEPFVHARLLQVAEPKPADVALVVGDGSGYASAILAQIVTTVITLVSSNAEKDALTKLCDGLEICNVVALKGDISKGVPDHAPYSLIFINGAVASVPDGLKKQLSPDGRLVSVIREQERMPGQATLITALGENGFSSYGHFDAATPFIPEFRPQPAFSF